MNVAIDRFGRMVLPKPLREDLGLVPGDVLDASAAPGGVLLRPVGRGEGLCRRGRLLVFRGRAVGDVAGAVRAQREERDRRVATAGRRA